MSRCYALTQDNHPCRNYAEVLQRTPYDILYAPTCKKHRGEENRHIFKHKLEWNMIYYNHTKRLLQDGVIVLHRDMVSFLTQRPGRNFTHFILLCAKYGKGFQRGWNKVVFDKALKDLWGQSRSIGPIEVKWEDLIEMGSCFEDAMEGFVALLTEFPEERPDEPSRDEWYNFIYKVLQSDWGKSILFHPDCLDSKYWDRFTDYCKRRPMSNLVPLIQSGHLYSIVKVEREEVYEKIRSRQNIFNNELLERTWDVERVIDWCMSVEEQCGVKERWGKK